MITSCRNRNAMLLVLVLGCTSLLPAAEIKGTVAKVAGQDITIKITSDFLPVAGDKLDVYVEIPNIGKAVVGRGAVATVDGETVVAKIDKATGKLVVGQLATITSPKPRKRQATKVPILIGRSAKDAKKAIEDAGYVAKVQVGVDAPKGVKPFSVYEQKPAANTELAAGETIEIKLYGGDPSPPLPSPLPEISVPDLIGKPGANVRPLIEKAGLVTKFRTGKVAVDGAKPLTVIDQSPKPGTVARRGETVTLTVLGLTWTKRPTTGEVSRYDPATHQYKVGDRVVVIRNNHLSLPGNKKVDRVWPGLTLSIGRINGKWLWLSNGIPGWLDKSNVVPLGPAAVERMTELISSDPNNDRFYGYRALIYNDLRRRDDARNDLNEAIRLNPKNASHWHHRGLTWFESLEFEKAIEDYSQAIRLDPNLIRSYANRAACRKCIGNYKGAIDDCNASIEINPNLTVSYIRRGICRRMLGDYAKALEDYEETLRRNPKNFEALLERALVRATAKDPTFRDAKEAIADAVKACELTAYNSTYPLSALAAAYAEAGNFEEAVKYGVQAIERARGSFEHERRVKMLETFLEGRPYREGGSASNGDPATSKHLKIRQPYQFAVGEQIVVLREDKLTGAGEGVAIRVEPGFVLRVQEVKGDLLRVTNGRSGWLSKSNAVPFNSEAIDRFTQMIAADPKNPALYRGRGMIHRRFRSPEKAIKDFTEAIRLKPDAMYFHERGGAYKDIDDFDRAVADYTEALRLKPNTVTFNNRAGAWFFKGEYSKAIDDYNEALRLDPKLTFAYLGRGMSHAGSGEFGKAISDFETVIRLHPRYFKSYRQLALLRATCPDSRLRDGKLALKQATKACEMSAWKDASCFAALAAAYAETEDFNKAVQWQTKAVEDASDRDLDSYKERLVLYRMGKPYRSGKDN